MKYRDTFIMRKEWLDSIKTIPLKEQDKIIADMVRYGVGLELEYEDEPHVASMVNLVKNSIDYTNEKYQHKVFMSKTAGRKKSVDDSEIYIRARAGKTAAEIAKELDISVSSVNHSDGWKNRKNNNFEI